MAAADITLKGRLPATLESDVTVRSVKIQTPVTAVLTHKSGDPVFISFLGGATVDTTGVQIEGVIELGLGDSFPLPPDTVGFKHQNDTGTGKFWYIPLSK